MHYIKAQDIKAQDFKDLSSLLTSSTDFLCV